MIDPSIAMQVRPVQMPDPINKMAQVLAVKQAQTQGDMAQYSLAKAQRQDTQMNALMSALQGGGLDLSTPEGQSKAFSIAPEAAAPLIKNIIDARAGQSTVTKNTAQAGNFDSEAAARRTQFFRDQLAGVTNPDQAKQWVAAQYSDPVLGKIVGNSMPVDAAVASVPTDPQQLQQWVQRNALGMSKFIELNAPKTNVVNSGQTTQLVQTPGLGGAPTVAGTIQNTVSPDAQLHANTSIQTTGMTNATARATNAATIAGENMRMGVAPGGGLDDNSERTAQAIASGQLPPPTGIALLNPRNQRILGRVMEINPQYDATTVTAKKAAATAFTTGTQGNSLRSFAVAGQHLDQLGQLVDAMGNGNLQAVNQISNFFSQQTGSPQITNFDAAKDVVSKEVMKAIVAGGGGVGEREELSRLMKNASSSAQLKGVIQQYRNLMSAQQGALLDQRRAAGLPDSTLPNYSTAAQPGAAAGATGGWQYLGVQK